jgi:hypothetical protein
MSEWLLSVLRNSAPARLTSASVNLDFDIPTTSDEYGLEQDDT